MGQSVMRLYGRITKEMKIAFVSTLIIGILIHLYKVTNYLPNLDSMYCFYTNHDMLKYGRWFLFVVGKLGSNFDLPWVHCFLSFLYIAITSTIIVKLFEIKNKIVIILCGAVLISFPSLTELLFFEYAADGFLFAMMLSALSIYVIRINQDSIKVSWKSVIVSALLVCFTCAIYQGFLSFTLVLGLCYLIWILLTTDYENKAYFKWIGFFALSCVIGLLIYYVIWKIVLAIFQVEPTSLYGIDNIGGFSISTVFNAVPKSIIILISFFVERNIFKHGISVFGVLNIIFLISFIFIFVYSIFKSKIWKNKLKLLIIVLSAIAIPFATTIWLFASNSVEYSTRMFYAICLLIILSVLLYNRFLINKISDIYALFVCVMVCNFAISANIAYQYFGMCYENTYKEAVMLQSDIRNYKNQNNIDSDVVIIGNREPQTALDYDGHAGEVFVFTSVIQKSLLSDGYHINEFFKNVFYSGEEYIYSGEIVDKIENSEKFQKMNNWPNKESIELIDNYIVIKLSDVPEAAQ